MREKRWAMSPLCAGGGTLSTGRGCDRVSPAPHHALRLRDLRGRADLVAVCDACRHSAAIWLWQPNEGNSDHQRLVEVKVKAKLRCQRCDDRVGNMARVPGAER